MTDLTGWNDYWRLQFQQSISESTLRKTGYFGLHSEESQAASVKYLITRNSGDYYALVTSELRAQWSDPVLVAGSLLAFAHTGVGLATEGGMQGFKSVGSGGGGFSKVLQSGGQKLNPGTLKALNLTKEQGRNAIHTLKSELRLPNNFHGKIMGNGDYLHPGTGEWLGNLFDFVQ
jgi:hypothetical protein